MKRFLYLLPALLLGLLTALPAVSGVYMEKDAEGNVIFTDRPSDEKAKPVEISPPSVYQAPPAPPSPRKPQPEKTATTRYESVVITSPADDEAVRANDGRLTVSVSISPKLQPKHMLELHMDGSKVAETQGYRFELAEVDRGTHTLQVHVVDAKGRTLISSKPSSFHLLRYTIPRRTPR